MADPDAMRLIDANIAPMFVFDAETLAVSATNVSVRQFLGRPLDDDLVGVSVADLCDEEELERLGRYLAHHDEACTYEEGWRYAPVRGVAPPLARQQWTLGITFRGVPSRLVILQP